jgi:hypothetical protein
MRSVAGLGAAGVAALAVGTFLPWLRSGAVLRDSFQAAAALRDLVQGVPAAALTAWPAVLPLCGLCVAGYATGLRRTAATLACLVALAAGLVACFALSTEPGTLLAVAPTGPATTLAGAALLLAGAVTTLVRGAKLAR